MSDVTVWIVCGHFDNEHDPEWRENYRREVPEWRLEDVLRGLRFRGYDTIYLQRKDKVRHEPWSPVPDGEQVWCG